MLYSFQFLATMKLAYVPSLVFNKASFPLQPYPNVPLHFLLCRRSHQFHSRPSAPKTKKYPMFRSIRLKWKTGLILTKRSQKIISE